MNVKTNVYHWLFEPTLALVSDARLLSAIRAQQDIQKRNAPTSDAWQTASNMLAPLFKEMQLRYPKGTVGPII